jgi:hypothetical protein
MLERSLATLTALLLAACGDRAPDGGAASEGVRTFEIRWATIVEEVRIDGYAEDLVPIQFVVVADDGGIAITQAQDAAVRFFTAEGEPAGRFGVQGEGPGEFLMTGRLGWLADTLWVFDPRVRRMTLIGLEGVRLTRRP